MYQYDLGEHDAATKTFGLTLLIIAFVSVITFTLYRFLLVIRIKLRRFRQKHQATVDLSLQVDPRRRELDHSITPMTSQN